MSQSIYLPPALPRTSIYAYYYYYYFLPPLIVVYLVMYNTLTDTLPT